MKETIDSEIIYIADPMCSWCWGFAPVVDQLIEQYGRIVPFRIIVGGLRPGEFAQEMDDAVKSYLSSHWHHVQEATGQPFNFEFFEREGFLYDTEPAARAVIAVRSLAPEKEFSFFKSVQKAFYAGNIDVTNEKNFAPILRDEGIDEDEFMKVYSSEENRQATYRDFSLSKELGIQGFPSMVIRKGERTQMLTRGYQTYNALRPGIENFLGIS